MNVDGFQALADPTRRRIVETLRGGEHQVNDVVERVAIHQSGVSRHLRILLAAGFVRVRPDGQRRLYSLRPEPFQELDSWLDGYRDLWEARLDRFEAALEKKRALRRSSPAPEEEPRRTAEKKRTPRRASPTLQEEPRRAAEKKQARRASSTPEEEPRRAAGPGRVKKRRSRGSVAARAKERSPRRAQRTTRTSKKEKKR